MKLPIHHLTYRYQNQEKKIRICPPRDGEVAVVCADLPTGRTSTGTLRLLKTNSKFEPFLRSEAVSGPKRGGRLAQVLTTSGVRKLVEHLTQEKPQPRHLESSEDATRWIKEELLPEMEAMEATVGRPKEILVGRPKDMPAGARSGQVAESIVIRAGSVAFSCEFLNPEIESISLTKGEVSRTWSASQLFEVMEQHGF